jgi:hypothetical protein
MFGCFNKSNKKMHVLTADEIDDYEEQEPIYCPHCEKRGYLVRLGPKILMNNERRPDDYDQWLECPTCMWLCPLYEIPKEATVKDAVETVESPTDDKLILESAHKRKPTRKVSRHINKKIGHSTDDPDIQREIRQHGEENVHVLYDSNS